MEGLVEPPAHADSRIDYYRVKRRVARTQGRSNGIPIAYIRDSEENVTCPLGGKLHIFENMHIVLQWGQRHFSQFRKLHS